MLFMLSHIYFCSTEVSALHAADCAGIHSGFKRVTSRLGLCQQQSNLAIITYETENCEFINNSALAIEIRCQRLTRYTVIGQNKESTVINVAVHALDILYKSLRCVQHRDRDERNEFVKDTVQALQSLR